MNKIKADKKRGFWLTAFLILMFIANPFTAFTYFNNPEEILAAYPKITTDILYFMGAIAILNVGLAIGIWNWRKWGIYGFYITVGIAFCLNVYVGIGLVGALIGLIGALIIFLTTKPRWEHFT